MKSAKKSHYTHELHSGTDVHLGNANAAKTQAESYMSELGNILKEKMASLKESEELLTTIERGMSGSTNVEALTKLNEAKTQLDAARNALALIKGGNPDNATQFQAKYNDVIGYNITAIDGPTSIRRQQPTSSASCNELIAHAQRCATAAVTAANEIRDVLVAIRDRDAKSFDAAIQNFKASAASIAQMTKEANTNNNASNTSEETNTSEGIEGQKSSSTSSSSSQPSSQISQSSSQVQALEVKGDDELIQTIVNNVKMAQKKVNLPFNDDQIIDKVLDSLALLQEVPVTSLVKRAVFACKGLDPKSLTENDNDNMVSAIAIRKLSRVQANLSSVQLDSSIQPGNIHYMPLHAAHQQSQGSSSASNNNAGAGNREEIKEGQKAQNQNK